MISKTQRQREEAELLGCKLAYEAGIHWLDGNVRALEALRTRCLALVSVMLIAATFVANLAPNADKEVALGTRGWVGILLFVLGMATTIGMGVYVVSTARITTELGPLKIIEKHVDPFLTWPSARIYKAIAKDLDCYANRSEELLRKRAKCYKWSLIGVPAGVMGLALVWIDVNL